MSLRIRLRRVGRKKQPSYRIVVVNSAAPRDGAYVEELGFYNPRTQPAELRLDLERVATWMTKGATLSTTASSLVRKAKKGGDAKVGYKAPGEPEPVAVVEAPVKPKRGPRKAAAPGSTGTGTPVVEAAAPVAPAAEAAPVVEAAAPMAEAAPVAEAAAAVEEAVAPVEGDVPAESTPPAEGAAE
jgi:small subunit ribosomal protein S16